MTVVEFVGAPGAGKSRLLSGAMREMRAVTPYEPPAATHRWMRRQSSRALLRGLLAILPTDLGTKVTNRLFARGLFLEDALTRFTFDHPGFLDTVRSLVAARATSLPEPELFEEWVQRLCARYVFAMEALDERSAFLLEDGFATRGVGLFAYGSDGSDDDDLARYVGAMPAPGVVVLVDTDVKICRARLEERGWTRRSRSLSEEGKRAYLEAAADLSRRITGALEARGSTAVRVSSENAAGAEDAVRRIVAAIEPSAGIAR